MAGFVEGGLRGNGLYQARPDIGHRHRRGLPPVRRCRSCLGGIGDVHEDCLRIRSSPEFDPRYRNDPLEPMLNES